MGGLLDKFVAGLKSSKTGGIVTTVNEMVENQFGIPLKHYAQQYLFGATGLRIQVFNSIQGQKEVGKSTLMFDLMGDICASEEDGGAGGLAVLYELEGKISPSILKSILHSHGDSAEESCLVNLHMTLEDAMRDLNTSVIPAYIKACPDMDKPLVIGFDSIGGAAAEDTISKLEKEGLAGKGYTNKQHIMKYFCENQGAIFAKSRIPVVVMCVNQEKERAAATPFAMPTKTITGGTAQLFKDGHMISATKKSLASGDGNVVYLKTTKTSFCDPRKIEVVFKWNKYGVKTEDAYEARFLWGLAAARCLADPDKGVGEIRDIIDVKLSDKDLVTCPQLGLKSVDADEFERALMADSKLLSQLYTYQKIERLQDLSAYGEYVKKQSKGAAADEAEAPQKKPASRKASKKPTPVNLFDVEDATNG